MSKTDCVFWISSAESVSEQEDLLGNPPIPDGAWYSDSFYNSVAGLSVCYQEDDRLGVTVVCLNWVDFFGRCFTNIFAFEGSSETFDNGLRTLLMSVRSPDVIPLVHCGGGVSIPYLPYLIEAQYAPSADLAPVVSVEGQYVPMLYSTSPDDFAGSFGARAVDWVRAVAIPDPDHWSEYFNVSVYTSQDALQIGTELFAQFSSVLQGLTRTHIPLNWSRKEHGPVQEVVYQDDVDLGKLLPIVPLS